MGEEDAGQKTGEGLDSGLDVVSSDCGDQVETGSKTGDADIVGGASLEFPAVGVMLETLQKEIVRGQRDVAPAGDDWVESGTKLRGGCHEAGAFRAEEPFMAVGHDRVDTECNQVKRQHTHPLDGVDYQDDAAISTHETKLCQRCNPAGVESDPRNRQQLCSLSHVLFHDLRVDTAVRLREAHDVDASALESEPGRYVGSKLLVSNQNLVAFDPVQAFGDQRKAFRGAANDRYVVGGAAGKLAAEVATAEVVILPLLVVVVSRLLLFGNALPHRLSDWLRQRTDRRVIEIQRVFPHRKLGQPVTKLECHVGIIPRPQPLGDLYAKGPRIQKTAIRLYGRTAIRPDGRTAGRLYGRTGWLTPELNSFGNEGGQGAGGSPLRFLERSL